MGQMNDEAWLIQKYQALEGEVRLGYALITLKIKRFRLFNRLYGRDVGNELIEKVYEAISGWLAADEYVASCRMNYFNLLVHMPRDEEGIFQRIISLNKAIRDMDDERFHGKVFSGMGICPLPVEAEDFYDIQYKADVSREECPQRTFRNSHFEVYGITYTEPQMNYFDLQQNIKPALDHGDFKLYLQPKVDLRTGEVTRAEALLRWVDPERGMIPLSDFLNGLEENGLITDVDICIFEQVCGCINRWLAEYGKKITISVNLSGCAFNYLYFFEEYERAYEKYLTPKDCIEFELLESIILNKAERVQQVVKQLRNFGFTCALDDFGSGFSAYGVLSATHFDRLKIDRSLFRNAGNVRERTVIKHIVESAHELEMEIVAEGVETMEYVDFLRELGCEYVQGFVFYKPMPAAEFEERFLKNGESAAVKLGLRKAEAHQ